MPLAQSGGSNVGSSQIIDNEIIDADINDGAGIQISKINFGTGLTNSHINVSLIQTALISLTSAELKNLHTTPKELVAAPGANKIVIVEQVIFYFTYVAPAYAGSAEFTISYNGSATKLVVNSGQMASTANLVQYWNVDDAVTTITDGTNKAVEAKNQGSAFITGNSTVKLGIKYRIITL